jgi:hypothetical protein
MTRALSLELCFYIAHAVKKEMCLYAHAWSNKKINRYANKKPR